MMTPLQLAILKYLELNAQGNTNAKTADVIYTKMTLQGEQIIIGRTQEHVRESVRSMIRDNGQLIGSKSGFGGNNGYYIINTKDEVIDTIMSLVGRSRSMLERVDALKHSWNILNPTNQI